MLPLTILATQKVSNLLTNGNALQQQIGAIATSVNITVPGISPAQVVLSSASPEIADNNVQLTYPRVCIYSNGLRNTHQEKFRSLSGALSVTTDVWTSGNLVSDTDQWIHFYVEAVTDIFRQSTGDWGDGIFFSGVYDVQFQPPKAGGLGFVQSAKITCSLNVGRS